MKPAGLAKRKPPPLYFTKQPFHYVVDPRVLNVWKRRQYSQRSPGWYKARDERITASAVASVIMQSEESCRSYIDYYKLQGKVKIDPTKSCNYKETQLDFILGKCGLGPKFRGNEYTRWGQKFENIVSNIYSQLRQIDILEFGLIPHPTIDFLAASPDGISTDGIMLEIKCPPCRQVMDYPPLHYWQQMQVQLACTDLQFCDYFDAHFVEYISLEDWETDAHKWHEENPEAKHHIFGIMLSYDLDAGEEDIDLSLVETGDDAKDALDDNDSEDVQDVTEDVDDLDEDDAKEPTDEKRTKHVYPPPNIRTVEGFKEWAEAVSASYERHGKQVTRTYYKLHEYYISRATSNSTWFERNLPSMAAIWEQVKFGRTTEGKAMLKQIVKDRETTKADRKAKRKSASDAAMSREARSAEDAKDDTKGDTKDAMYVKEAQGTCIFVDLDVSKVLDEIPSKGKKSAYIHETCLL
jgi:hypothetical protein